MNKISIFLYLADVFGKIDVTFWILAIAILVVTGIRYLIRSDYNPRHDYNDNGWPSKPSKWNFFFAILLVILASLIPSANTMYMIAGSETAQTIVTSDTGQKVLDNLNKIIVEYTKPKSN